MPPAVASSLSIARSVPTWRLIAGVFKPRIALEIMLSAIAGVAIAGGQGLTPLQFIGFAAAVFGAAGAAGAFNQFVERDIDARMTRTAGRPFVTGALLPAYGWVTAIVTLLVVSVLGARLLTNWAAALWILLGALTYGVVYTVWLKRRTWLNIVIGGLAGSFAVLAGAAAVTPTLNASVWVFAIVMFLWTPPHFWSLTIYYRDDYAAAGIPMLPIVHGDRVATRAILAHTVLLVALSFLPLLWTMGWVYGLCAALGGGLFLQRSVILLRAPTARNAIRNFLASLTHLGLLLLGAIVDGALAGQLIRY